MIGQKIRNLRKEKKMSQSELAKMLAVSQTTVTAWETGKAEPSSSAITNLAAFFNVSTDYLLDIKPSAHTDIDLDKALDSAMTFEGRALTDEERTAMKEILKAYLKTKR